MKIKVLEINNLLQYKSISIIGTEKNTGKTECLNYIFKKLHSLKKIIAVTSIGVDGENIDIVTNSHKPEIELFPNNIFITSEKHYRQKKIDSEILNISERQTSLGRLIIARAKNKGKVILSGPTNSIWLKEILNSMNNYNVDLSIVDGAISRKSLAAPNITDAFILNTGAALSSNINTLINSTKFLLDLININTCPDYLKNLLSEIKNIGIYGINEDYISIYAINVKSSFFFDEHRNEILKYKILFANGLITNKLLDFLRIQTDISERKLIISDFTKIFVSPESFYAFKNAGGKIFSYYSPRLLAVCVNPISPNGFSLNSDELIFKMKNEFKIDVFDIKKI